MLSEGTCLVEKEEASAAAFCLLSAGQNPCSRRKSGTKTFICLRDVLQLLFSRDVFPPTVIYNLDGTILLSAEDGPLHKKQMHDL